MEHDIDWLKLSDYVADRASPALRAEIEDWVAAAPERRQFVESLRTVWERAGVVREPIGPIDRSVAWQSVARRLQSTTGDGIPLRVRRTNWRTLGVAAALVLGAIGVVKLMRVARTDPAPTVAVQSMREVRTEPGQRASIQLVDGTRVVLGVDSRLQWPTDVTGARDVYLEGEAYFDVQHDATRPFRVHVGDVVAEDIGTAFAIRGYPGDARISVAIESGSVALAMSDRAPKTVLAAGDVAIRTTGTPGAIDVRHGADLTSYLAFREGRVVFDQAPLRDVLTELTRWYGLNVIPMDSALVRARVTWTFEADSTSAVLPTLARILDARYEQHGRTVHLFVRR